MARNKRTCNSSTKSTKKSKVSSKQSVADLTFEMKSSNEKLDQDDFQKGPTTSDIQGPKISDSDNVCLPRYSLRSSSTSKLCCETSDSGETGNKTVKTKSNKKASICKTQDSSGDFNEKLNLINVKSSSKRLIHTQENVACESKTRKKKSATITSLTEFTDKTSCDTEPKSKNNELSKSLALHESITENFDFNPDKEIVESLSPNELTLQLSESSSNINFISKLNSIIDKVKNLQIQPYIYADSMSVQADRYTYG